MKIENAWIRRLVRGAALWSIMMVFAAIIPGTVKSGDLGTVAYLLATWLVSGFVIWHIVDRIDGGA